MQNLYTIEEFAEMFKMSRSGVLLMIRSDRIHAVKVGRQWLISQEEVDRVTKEGA